MFFKSEDKQYFSSKDGTISILRPFTKGASIYDVHTGRGRGCPKSRQKEQNQLIYVCDKGGGG